MEHYYLDFDAVIWKTALASLAVRDRERLLSIRGALPIAADISRSDVFLFFPEEAHFCIDAHARSHAMATLYEQPQAGRCLTRKERPWLWQAIVKGRYARRLLKEVPEVQTEVLQQIWPIRGIDDRVIAAVGVFTNAVELARHKRRSRSFQKALRRFFGMLANAQLQGCEMLPAYTERCGIVFIDGIGRYRYLSGIAANVYRRLGYLDDLRLRTTEEVAAGDRDLVREAWKQERAFFSESVVRNRILQRSVIPLFGKPDHFNFWEALQWRRKGGDRYGALLLVHDITEEREKENQLKVKSAMIKEVHHRLKNNLQLLVSVLRMQARRTKTGEAQQIINEAMNRLLSMSVIHESLSYGEGEELNLREVIKQVAPQTQRSMVGPNRHIDIRIVEADDVLLSPNKVTTCALVFNELLLNAVKHGFSDQSTGEIRIYLYDRNDKVELVMEDTGQGLPEDFSPDRNASIGLDIIRTLVQDDLKGHIDFATPPTGGARVTLRFPKKNIGGTEQ